MKPATLSSNRNAAAKESPHRVTCISVRIPLDLRVEWGGSFFRMAATRYNYFKANHFRVSKTYISGDNMDMAQKGGGKGFKKHEI